MKYNCLNILKWTEAQLKYTYDVSLQEATPQELHEALGKAVMMSIADNWSASKAARLQKRKAYYISAEYLIGRLVYSNLFNLGILDEMKKLFAEFEAELREAEKKRQVDPIFLAAKYCQEFVMINPFLDGNSRTYRLILNAILMKYMGVVIGIGGNEDERAHYLGICRRAGEEMGDPGELASLVLEKVKERLEKMDSSLGCLEGDGGGWSIQV